MRPPGGRISGTTGPAAHRRWQRRRTVGCLPYDPGFELLFLLQACGDGVSFTAIFVLADAHAEDRRRALRRSDDVGGITLAGKALHDHIRLLAFTKGGHLDSEAGSGGLG